MVKAQSAVSGAGREPAPESPGEGRQHFAADPDTAPANYERAVADAAKEAVKAAEASAESVRKAVDVARAQIHQRLCEKSSGNHSVSRPPGWRVRIISLRASSSFRSTAMNATCLGLPAATRRR